MMFWYRLINDPKKMFHFFPFECLLFVSYIFNNKMSIYDVLLYVFSIESLAGWSQCSQITWAICMHVWQSSSSSSWDPIKYHPYLNWFFFSVFCCLFHLSSRFLAEWSEWWPWIYRISWMHYHFENDFSISTTAEKSKIVREIPIYFFIWMLFNMRYRFAYTIHWFDLL